MGFLPNCTQNENKTEKSLSLGIEQNFKKIIKMTTEFMNRNK
jgi:hypothetical protein